MKDELIKLNEELSKLIIIRDSLKKDDEAYLDCINDMALLVWDSSIPGKAVSRFGYFNSTMDVDDYKSRLWIRIHRACKQVNCETAAQPTTYFHRVMQWSCSHSNLLDRYQVSVPQRLLTGADKPKELSLDWTDGSVDGDKGLSHTLPDSRAKAPYDAITRQEKAIALDAWISELTNKLDGYDYKIVKELINGRSQADIAMDIGVSRQYVSSRLLKIRRKYFGSKKRLEAIRDKN